MRDTDLAEIRALALFRDIGDAAFAALTRGAYHQTFPPQVNLISEGEAADFLHVLTDGSVELFAGWSGRETTMSVLRPVSTFILAACINDAPYLMSARTLVQSRIMMIPVSDLRAAFAADPVFAQAIVRELAGCYRSVVRHAKDLKLRASRERLDASTSKEFSAGRKTARPQSPAPPPAGPMPMYNFPSAAASERI